MAKHFLPDFRINADTYESGIASLFKIIKPSWKVESISIKPITGGYSGRVYRCHEEGKPEDSLTVRVRHASEKIKTWKNDMEFQIVQHMAKAGHFPIVHAIFANGYCYEYIKGRPMINQRQRQGESIDDTMLIAIAKELAFIHKIKLDDVEYSKTTYFSNIRTIFEVIDFVKLTESSPSKKAIFREIDFIEEYLLSKKPRVVTCHGDVHAGNFVWDDDAKKVTFVDWEGVRTGYQLQDIVYFFLASTLLEPLTSKRKVEEVVPSDFKRKFFQTYLQEWYRTDEGEKEVSKEDIDTWLKDSEAFALGPLIYYILLPLTFPDSIQEYSGDKFKFFDIAMNEYLTLKDKLTGRRSFEIES